MTITDLLARLEAISRGRPDRVLRLRGTLPADDGGAPVELLRFRGFSSGGSHPPGFDPDQPALPEGAAIEAAELLRGPLNPTAEERLAGPAPAETFLDPAAWL
jgi:hypothetical protein